jgi:hypothetical protein
MGRGMKARRVISAAVFCALCIAPALPQSKKTPRRFVPPQPKNFYILNPFVSKDEGCAKDYAKTFSLDGIEVRKAMTQLVVFGCGERIEGFFRVYIRDSDTVALNGESVILRRVDLVIEPDVLETADRSAATGWLPDATLTPLSAEELKALSRTAHSSTSKVEPSKP